MQQRIVRWWLDLDQKKLTKVLAVLIAVFLILSVCINAVDSTLLAMTAQSQVSPASVMWQKTYGGAGDDRAFYSLPTQSGSFLAVGSSQSLMENATVGWALMLDAEGNMVWNKTYLEGFGTELRFALSVDGGFLLVGNQFSSTGDVHGYVAKVDVNGNLLWYTTVGSSTLDKIFSAAAAEDGYALFGLTYTAKDQSNGWVVKLNSDGNIMWNKTYTANALRSAVSTDDGGFAVAGYAVSSVGGDYDFTILKLNADGNLVWNYTYGTADDEKAYSIAKAPDGYVVVGDADSRESSTDAWVVKVDLNGKLLWQKTVGGKDADSPAYVTTSQDGYYLVAGFTFSYGAGYRDFWLFKICDAGQVLWSCTQGTDSYQEAYGVVEQGPNSYVMVGWTDPIGHPELVGKKTYDIYIAEVSVEPVNAVLSSAKWVEYLFLALALAASLALISKLYVARQPKLEQK